MGYDPAIVNALRRILLSDIPSMAIEKIHMYQVSLDERERKCDENVCRTRV